MPDIFLLIPEAPLRDAVAEQIRAMKLGDVRAISSAEDVPTETSGFPIVVVDASDKKGKVAMEAVLGRSERPVLLVLGGEEEAENATETFTKPFRLGHLMTRLRYYLETAPWLREDTVVFGPFRLEPQNRRLVRGQDDPLRLTEKETALLAFLARAKGAASRQDILASVWGYDERIDTHTLETHVYQLRKKIDRDGENWLVSDQGGYRLAGIEG